jgi:hypothetical protein
MRIDDEEPVDYLWTGEIVLRAVASLVRWLQSRGHTITVGDDTRVRVVPPVPPDAWCVLDSNWGDVAAVLEAQQLTGFRPAHQLGTRSAWTVH